MTRGGTVSWALVRRIAGLGRALGSSETELERVARPGLASAAAVLRDADHFAFLYGRGYATRSSKHRHGFDNTLGRCSVDAGSEEYARNKEAMDKLVEKLEEDMRRIAKGGGDDAIKRAVKRGKLLVRDRINQLLDPGKLERSNRIELTRREPSLTLSLPPTSPPPEQVPRFSSSACTLARAFTAATWSPAAAS